MNATLAKPPKLDMSFCLYSLWLPSTELPPPKLHISKPQSQIPTQQRAVFKIIMSREDLFACFEI